MADKVKIELAKKVKYNGQHHTSGSELEIGDGELDWFKRNGLVARVLTKYEEKQSDGGNDSGEDGIDPGSLEDKNTEELYKIAQDLDIEGRTKLRSDKEAMIKAIEKKLEETQEAGE